MSFDVREGVINLIGRDGAPSQNTLSMTVAVRALIKIAVEAWMKLDLKRRSSVVRQRQSVEQVTRVVEDVHGLLH
jgi:hypothetical protein